MRCSWCGGEILEPFEYVAPDGRTVFMEMLCEGMREKRFCSPRCLGQNLRSIAMNIELPAVPLEEQ